MNKVLAIGFLSLTMGLLLFGCLGGDRKQVTPTPSVVIQPTNTPVGTATSTPQASVPSDLPTLSDADLAGLDGIESDSGALGDLDDDGPEFPEE